MTPEGSPSTVSDTSPVNPPDRVSDTVTLPVEPCVTLSVLAESEMAIAGVGLVPPSLPPHAASVPATKSAVPSLFTSCMPTRTRPPSEMTDQYPARMSRAGV